MRPSPWLVVAILLLASHPALAQESPAPQEPPAQGYPVPGYPQPFVTGTAISPAEATKLRVLEADLNVLSQMSGGRVLNGSLSIVFGAAFFAIGVWVDDTLVSTLLEVTGGLAITRGVVEIAFLPRADDAALQYTHMPMLTREQVRTRIAFGETELTRIARTTRRARLIDGTLTMAAGATYVPLYLLRKQGQEPDYHFADDPADWIAVGIGAISFAAGLITTLRKSEAEQRAKAYAKLKDEVDSRSSAFLRPTLQLSVRPDGLALFAQSKF